MAANVSEFVRAHPAKDILSALLNRYAVADLLDAFADVATMHMNVPGGGMIAADIKRLTDGLPTAAYRTP